MVVAAVAVHWDPCSPAAVTDASAFAVEAASASVAAVTCPRCAMVHAHEVPRLSACRMLLCVLR